MSPVANLSPLQRADGSASYSSGGYSVLAAVNGPVEVQRRDELPQEAAIDVIIRPAAGVGGVRERHLESIIHKTLCHTVLVSAHPRTLIQVVLQVTATPEGDSVSGKLPQADSNLSILPALLQASMLALLSSSIPLRATLTATSIAVSALGTLIRDPTPKQRQEATSQHVLAFTSHGDLLVAESEGRFDMDKWEQVVAEAIRVCRGDAGPLDEDVSMDSGESSSLEGFMRDVVQAKITTDQRWKESIR